jgi:hypothetical protein
MPPTKHDLDRLAKLARRRRAELGLAMNDTNAKAANLSKATWQRVEKGLAIRETNYVKIDGLLKWAPGSCIAVLDGGNPTLLPGEPGDGGMSEELHGHAQPDVPPSGDRDDARVRAIDALWETLSPEERRQQLRRLQATEGQELDTEEPPYADMSPKEQDIWDWKELSREDRLRIIDVIRAGRRHRKHA